MSSTSGFLIRDGLESDITACLMLDHHYETDYVWQMHITEDRNNRQITFSTQRLPRTLQTEFPLSEHRLHLALDRQQCFLVAAARDNPEILGYLTLQRDLSHRLAYIQDLVISRSYRRKRIATKLVAIAYQWAKEQALARLIIETQTQNYPSILFCQQTGFIFSGYNDHYFSNQDIALFFSQSVR
jgi:ribosomal protein S18 acetylase RimI-like enzyme